MPIHGPAALESIRPQSRPEESQSLILVPRIPNPYAPHRFRGAARFVSHGWFRTVLVLKSQPPDPVPMPYIEQTDEKGNSSVRTLPGSQEETAGTVLDKEKWRFSQNGSTLLLLSKVWRISTIPDTKAEEERCRPRRAWNICRSRPFPHTDAPASSYCVSSFSAPIFVIHAASPRKGTGKVSRHKQKRVGTVRCRLPAVNAGRLGPYVLSNVAVINRRDPTGSQFAVWNSLCHTCLKSVTWAETSVDDVLTVYSDSDTVWSGIFRKDSFSCGPDFSRPCVSSPGGC